MAKRGEVWQVDFGMAQKVRPAVVVSVPYEDADRALIAVNARSDSKKCALGHPRAAGFV